MATDDFQVGRMGFCPDGKKRAKGELPNGETEKGIPQHIPKKVNNTGTFKGIKAERRKE